MPSKNDAGSSRRSPRPRLAWHRLNVYLGRKLSSPFIPCRLTLAPHSPMRKKIAAPQAGNASPGPGQWLDVSQLAVVEITSEEPSHPIESAFAPSGGPGYPPGRTANYAGWWRRVGAAGIPRDARLAARGEPRFRADQAWRWAARGARGYGEMTDLPAGLRAQLEQGQPMTGEGAHGT